MSLFLSMPEYTANVDALGALNFRMYKIFKIRKKQNIIKQDHQKCLEK